MKTRREDDGHRKKVKNKNPRRHESQPRMERMKHLLCRPKPIRTVLFFFLKLNSRFEFDFLSSRKLLFFERFEILVCSKFHHTQCGRTCACAVACLYPHNSISNIVASVTNHDKYIYIYIKRDAAKKKHETTVEGQRLFQPIIMESV